MNLLKTNSCMRKYLILLLLAFTGLQAFADDVIVTVNDLKWGEKNELEVCMTNKDEVNGFQADIILPDGFSLDGNGKRSVDPDVTERLAGLTVMCRALSNGKFRLVVLSMSGKKVKEKEGVIMRIPVKVEESTAKGKYEVQLVNASASITIDGKLQSAKIPNSTSVINYK